MWRRLVGAEDLTRPTRRRWVLLAIGLVLTAGLGFVLGLTLPGRDDVAGWAEPRADRA